MCHRGSPEVGGGVVMLQRLTKEINTFGPAKVSLKGGLESIGFLSTC